MGSQVQHVKLVLENLEGARDEYAKRRYSNVALLAVRSLEQSVEASAAKEGLHFHEEPRMAHASRRIWLRTHHPDLLKEWDAIWSIYGALGYGGVDGRRAIQALQALERLVEELEAREEIGLQSRS